MLCWHIFTFKAISQLIWRFVKYLPEYGIEQADFQAEPFIKA